jgi:hypothetical protein
MCKTWGRIRDPDPYLDRHHKMESRIRIRIGINMMPIQTTLSIIMHILNFLLHYLSTG